jgi:hypothetical protein
MEIDLVFPSAPDRPVTAAVVVRKDLPQVITRGSAKGEDESATRSGYQGAGMKHGPVFKGCIIKQVAYCQSRAATLSRFALV